MVISSVYQAIGKPLLLICGDKEEAAYFLNDLEQLLDAKDLFVLPGGVDPHVHLSRRPSLPPEAADGEDFTSGSWAALAGGVTTVGEIASPEEGGYPV